MSNNHKNRPLFTFLFMRIMPLTFPQQLSLGSDFGGDIDGGPESPTSSRLMPPGMGTVHFQDYWWEVMMQFVTTDWSTWNSAPLPPVH